MKPETDFIGLFREKKICVIIPTYNNINTLPGVVEEVMLYTDQVIIANDGSTDGTAGFLQNHPQLTVVNIPQNKGKGNALKLAFREAWKEGMLYAITMDADGQHYASDLVNFLEEHQQHPEAVIIGARNIAIEGMPAKNTFANRFSNFWFWVETGRRMPDTQSGFRMYPLNPLAGWHYFTAKYEFEIEVLVRADWMGIDIRSIPISVYYPPVEERVSHFRPLPDFTRISILNTILVLLTPLLAWPLKVWRYFRDNPFKRIVTRQLSMHNENSLKAATALGFGVFMGIIPIWGFQMLVAAFLAHLLKLNKVLVLAASNISLPPLIPFIVFFSFELGRLVVPEPVDFTMEMMYFLKEQVMQGHFYKALDEFGYSILQYVAGSFVLALSMGSLVTASSWVLLSSIKNSKRSANG